MQIYGDRISGNCLKVLYTADKLNIPYEWIDVDILKGEAQTPEFLALNPSGQVPAVVLDDGGTLAQSNAIISYLAEGSDLFPADPYNRAKINEWLYWEQYSHEPYIAVCRFQKVYLGKSDRDLDPDKVKRGYAALDRMERALSDAPYLVGDNLTIADIALVAYTRLAHDGGFDLTAYGKVMAWISRIEADLSL